MVLFNSRKMKKVIIAIIGVLVLMGCAQRPENPTMENKLPSIYPDYIGITIPAEIAPLNFNFTGGDIDCINVVIKGSNGGELHVQGNYADFDIDKWHELTQQNKGGELTFTVCVKQEGQWKQYQDFKVKVSP